VTDPRAQEASERGLAAIRLSDWPAAAQAFLEAVQLAPGSVHAWYNLANARTRAGDHAGALPAVLRALRLESRFPNLQLLAGNIHAELGQYPAAVERYVAAVEQDPRQIIASINLAVAFERLSLHEEACECYEVAIMLGADRSTALSSMYYAAQSCGRWDISADAQARFDQYVREGGENRAAPFQMLTMESTRAMQLEAARNYAKRML
jgi:protein O-GlcNAc transferase